MRKALSCFSSRKLQSDTFNHVIRRIIISSGAVSTIVGNITRGCVSVDGIYAAAGLCLPAQITLNAAGTFALFVSPDTIREDRADRSLDRDTM